MIYHNNGNLVDAKDMLSGLLVSARSTTMYLESMHGRKLNVSLMHQSEDAMHIQRVTRLYFSSEETPLIYSVSTIRKKLLTEREYEMITQGKQPLGKIFSLLNHPSMIYKINIEVEEDAFSKEAGIMKLAEGGPLYRKSYDFLVGARDVAMIEEFFNEESLSRK